MSIYPANSAPILPGLVAQAGLSTPIVAIDVGCSGGIDPEWAPLMSTLEVYAIDPLVKEIERLRNDAPLPNVRYFDGHVIGPPLPQWTRHFGRSGGKGPPASRRGRRSLETTISRSLTRAKRL